MAEICRKPGGHGTHLLLLEVHLQAGARRDQEIPVRCLFVVFTREELCSCQRYKCCTYVRELCSCQLLMCCGQPQGDVLHPHAPPADRGYGKRTAVTPQYSMSGTFPLCLRCDPVLPCAMILYCLGNSSDTYRRCRVTSGVYADPNLTTQDRPSTKLKK